MFRYIIVAIAMWIICWALISQLSFSGWEVSGSVAAGVATLIVGIASAAMLNDYYSKKGEDE